IMDNYNEKAIILNDAFKYINKYQNKIVVVKYGGALLSDEDSNCIDSIINDIVLLSKVGIKIVVVHGGGPDINEMLALINHKSKFIDGLRYTDQKSMEVALMVLAGKVNKNLVNKINQKNAQAIGLSGLDGNMVQATLIDYEKYGLVGNISSVNTHIITSNLEHNYIPIISSIASDQEGNILNINADTLAASISAQLQATSYVNMSDVDGVYLDYHDKNSLVSSIHVSDVPHLISSNVINGGMIPKVDSCTKAVRDGVNRAFIINGSKPHALLIELMSNEGVGTMFYQEEELANE
ncbi:MAG: acetylglutamate kinase, partial [Bacilli bacterium]